MSNWIFVIIMILLAILAYFIGLTRGITGSQHLYDEGWMAAEEYFKRFPELVQDINEETERDNNQKYEIARQMVSELDELFDDECPLPEDDDDIVDGGTY